jgi:hypothetical protein
MTKLSGIKNDKLLFDLKTLVSDEKKLIRDILEYLEEVETRRLFLEKGFSSMFSFCTDFLGYSPQEAQIRIQAMRLGKALPEVKEQIQSGELSLSVAARVQAHVGREQKIRKLENEKPLDLQDKREIVKCVNNQSIRKSEEILLSIFPHHAVEEPEKVKAAGSDRVRVEMNLSKETYELLMKVKSLRSHVSDDFDGLVKDLCQMALRKHDPVEKKLKPKKLLFAQTVSAEKAYSSDRYISSSQKHSVWMRDQGRCTYKDRQTGRTCDSKYRVQYDHIQPISFGGKTTVENLRLLCFNHHQLITEKSFGPWTSAKDSRLQL